MCLDMCQQIDNRFINVKGLAGTLKEKRVLIVAISKYVNPVKHWFHVWRPATRTRHLHPSLVLYQPGSLMSSHVLANCSQVPMLTSYWVPRAPCHFCVNLHRLNLFLAAKLGSMERRFLVQIIDRIRNSMLVTQV